MMAAWLRRNPGFDGVATPSHRHRARLPVVLLAFGLAGTAQVPNARLEGVVADPARSGVPQAIVRASNLRTGIESRTVTGIQGAYAFPSLPPGIYSLQVEAPGFRAAVVSDLVLNVGSTVWLPVSLEVGQVRDLVQVQAGRERVQTTGAEVARTVAMRDIDLQPQLVRWPVLLAVFNPGVQIPGGAYATARVNGTRQGSTGARLDGIDIVQGLAPSLGLAVVPTNPDTVEEFRFVSSGAKAEYGHSAGGQIDMITRSGTSLWHGNLFEYHRNTALNANSFFNNTAGLARPVFLQHVFGASLGGPLRRDRTFLFGNYQGRRTSEQAGVNRTVLTPEAKSGLFRWRSPGDAAIRSFDIARNDPRSKGIDPKVSELLRLLPEPNNFDIGDGLNTAGFRFNNPASSGLGRNDAITLKVDHILSGGHRVFFRWAEDHLEFADVGASFPGQAIGTQGGPQRSWAAGSDWALTARLMNELRAGYKSFEQRVNRPARLSGAMIVPNSWSSPLNPAFGSFAAMPVLQVADNISTVRGGHLFKFGGEIRYTRTRTSSDAGIWPNVAFSTSDAPVPAGIGPSGAAISAVDRLAFERIYNDLLGRAGSVTQTFYSDLATFQSAGTPRRREFRDHEFAGFLQDDWKIHPRLTLNLGLRFEFRSVPSEVNGFQGAAGSNDLMSLQWQAADLSIERRRAWYGSDGNNWAPRAGLAWDPWGDGKTALRLGWGLYYDALIGAAFNLVDSLTPGFSQQVTVFPNSAPGSDVRISDGIASPPQPAAPTLRPPTTRSTAFVLFLPGLRSGYVQHYSLTLQRELHRDTVLEAGYVATRGVKLLMHLDLNQPRIYDGYLAAFRELQAFRLGAGAVPASNPLVRMFGSAAAAIAAVGPNNLDLGAAGSSADSIDRLQFSRYASAGLSGFWLRNYPQFSSVVAGTNDGRSYYDSLQLSLRRQTGRLKFAGNYTFSKSLDNISTDGNGFNSPVDNFNVRLNRARGDTDIPHAFNLGLTYSLSTGRGSWPRTLALGWDLGLLGIWQSGRTISFFSGVPTGPRASSGFANIAGDRNIGAVERRGNGVWWLTPADIAGFSLPAAGEIGNSGRNAFRGPRFFNLDAALSRRFRLGDRQSFVFRAEAYNLLNNTNFGAPGTDRSQAAAFGRISSTTGNPRILQAALRFEF